MSVSSYILIGLSLGLSLIFLPLVILFCKKLSLYDSTNARKIHSGNIPRLGSVAFVLAFFISISIYFFIQDNNSAFLTMWPIIASGGLIFIFGVLDDIFDLRAILKLLVQIVATLILVLNGFRFRNIFGLQLQYHLSIVLTFIWVIGIINAYNLIDGLDGLCGILSFSALLTYAFLFLCNDYVHGAVMCMILSASIAGFLVFNWPPAKIFMGDGGSQFLGFMIATVPLYPIGNSVFEGNKFLVMLVLVSFPMLDTVAAIWRRIRDHRPIMSPDRLHLHHKLLNIGFTKEHALYFVCAIQVVICIIVILAVRITSSNQARILLIIAYCLMIGFFGLIHYINRAALRRITKENQIRNSGIIPDYHQETGTTAPAEKVKAIIVEDDSENGEK